MPKRALPLLVLALLFACRGDTSTGPHPAQSISVLTQHNDNTRAGLNDHETLLNTSNVNVNGFGKVFTLTVDDEVYAQPLVVAGVGIGGGTHNVVYVATVSNRVYAFDGDDGTPYWQHDYTAPGMRPPKNTDMGGGSANGACGGWYPNFSGNMGIVGTPVIDATTHIMYFVARSTAMDATSYVQYLHAIDIVTGSEVAGSPVVISASVNGNGDGAFNGVVSFDPQKANQRQALTLVNGTVYVTFSSHCDWGPYHGWVLGYDAATLQQTRVYNDTPNGYAGGVWESGMGMAADAEGNLYEVSGNGSVGDGGDPANLTNRSETALRLTPSGSSFTISTWFTPYDFQMLNDYDLDYGVMGSLLIPNSSYFFTGAKDGILYLLNTADMGGYHATDQVQQRLSIGGGSNLHAQPAYYKGSTQEFVYVWSENDWLRGIPFDRGSNTLRLDQESTNRQGGPSGQTGAMISVSSDGTKDGTGIVWAAYAQSGDAESFVTPGILRAFDANDVSRELWNNRQNAGRDSAGTFAKFSSPTIANGRVYLPTFSHRVVVYGLLQ